MAVPRRLWLLRRGHLPGATASIHVRFRQRSRHTRVVMRDGYDEIAAMTIETVPPPEIAQAPDEEWFGEGSAFDSGEDLAAALFALAGVEPRAEPAAAEVTVPLAPVAEADS